MGVRIHGPASPGRREPAANWRINHMVQMFRCKATKATFLPVPA